MAMEMKFLSRQQVMNIIQAGIEEHGTKKDLAKAWGISPWVLYQPFTVKSELPVQKQVRDRLNLDMPTEFFVWEDGQLIVKEMYRIKSED